LSRAEPTFFDSGSTADFFVAVAAAMKNPSRKDNGSRNEVVRIAGNARKNPSPALDFKQRAAR
jgi:hypothetical protein